MLVSAGAVGMVVIMIMIVVVVAEHRHSYSAGADETAAPPSGREIPLRHNRP